MRIAHVITRLILGGAQENVVLCCEDLLRDYGDDVLLITGPALGPEGSLLDRARAGGVPLAMIDPSCGGPSIPGATWCATAQIRSGAAAISVPTSSIPTAPRAASSAAPPPGACAFRPSSIPYTGAVSSLPEQGGEILLPGLRTLGRAAMPRLGQRGRRHDRADGRRRRRPAGKVHDHLQRHGGRTAAGVRAAAATPCAASWAIGPTTSSSARSPGCFTSRATST